MLRRAWFITPLLWLFSAISLASIESRDIADEYFLIIDDNSTTINSKNRSKNLADMMELEHGIISAGGKVLNKYYLVFTGIHAKLSQNALAQIETLTSIQKIQPNELAYLVGEPSADPLAVSSWGIDRIDQRDLPLSSSYTEPVGGTTAHAYIIDSGIRSNHVEFIGRIGDGISTIGEPSIEDCLGHGTHVAGTVLGKTVGVFTNSVVHPVRVFGCSGSTTFDAILKGLEWVIANHKKPAVANMSLGANTTVDLIDVAVRNTVASGVTVVVAAGNSNLDACQATPAREPSAITVAASDSADRRASFSNFGSCVDVIAPGVAIISSYHTGDNAYSSLSGTSMASPHACGAAAILASQHPTWTPKQISDEMVAKATPDKISDPRGTPNKLLYVSDFNSDSLFVDAGADIVKTIPDNNITLIGSAKTVGGYIVEGKWRRISGPAFLGDTIASSDVEFRLLLKNLPVGRYVFRLTASDSAGKTAFDDVNVTVLGSNQPPVANAGSDTRINPQGSVGNDLIAQLNGSGSSDPNGNIASYSWDVVEGDATKVSIVNKNAQNTTLTATTPGKYVIRLTVTDDGGLQSTDDMIVSVNTPPVSNAGPDFEVSASAASFVLSGTSFDADNDSAYTLWWQIDGPNRVNLSNFYGNQTTVTGFVAGKYTFRFFVVDSLKALGYDDVIVTVK